MKVYIYIYTDYRSVQSSWNTIWQHLGKINKKVASPEPIIHSQGKTLVHVHWDT